MERQNSVVSPTAPSVGSSIGLLVVLLLVLGLAEAVVAYALSSTVTASTRLLVALLISWPVVLSGAKKLHGAPLTETFLLVKAPLSTALLAGFAGLSLGLFILSLVTYIPTPPPQSVTKLAEIVSTSNRVSMLLAMLVVGPAAEELFFRGWMLPVWARRFGDRWAIVATTLLFSLLHILSWRVALALPIGLLLGWITIRSRSVIPAIVAHSASNLAPSLMDPILHLAGLTSSDIAALESIPMWLPAAAFLALVGSISLVGFNKPRNHLDHL